MYIGIDTDGDIAMGMVLTVQIHKHILCVLWLETMSIDHRDGKVYGRCYGGGDDDDDGVGVDVGVGDGDGDGVGDGDGDGDGCRVAVDKS